MYHVAQIGRNTFKWTPPNPKTLAGNVSNKTNVDLLMKTNAYVNTTSKITIVSHHKWQRSRWGHYIIDLFLFVTVRRERRKLSLTFPPRCSFSHHLPFKLHRAVASKGATPATVFGLKAQWRRPITCRKLLAHPIARSGLVTHLVHNVKMYSIFLTRSVYMALKHEGWKALGVREGGVLTRGRVSSCCLRCKWRGRADDTKGRVWRATGCVWPKSFWCSIDPTDA